MVVVWLSDRAAGHVAHGVDPVFLQFSGIPLSYAPKIRQRPVIPQQAAVGHLVQLCDPRPVLVRLNVLGHDIHGHLAQIQVRADSRRGRNPGCLEHILHHLCRQLAGCEAVGAQIGGHIHKHLVDGIDVDILGCNVFQVNVVNTGAVFHIERHSGRSRDIGNGPLRETVQLIRIPGRAGEDASGSRDPPSGVGLPDLLHHLEQPGPPGNPVGLHGRGHG